MPEMYDERPERVIITGEDQTTRHEWSEQIVIGKPPAECQPSAKPDKPLNVDRWELLEAIERSIFNASMYLGDGDRRAYLACLDQANSDLDFILTLEKDAEVTP
jgi:hypothetical protein